MRTAETRAGPRTCLSRKPDGAGPDGGVERVLLGVAGQHQAPQRRDPFEEAAAEIGAVPVRQPHVEEGDVGPDRRHPGQRLGARPRLAGHRDPRIVLEHLGHPAADDLVVVDQEDPHERCDGMHAAGLLPAPGTRQFGD